MPPREREQRLLDHELRWRRWSLGLPIEADCTSDEMSSLEHDASAETPAVSASEEDDEQEDTCDDDDEEDDDEYEYESNSDCDSSGGHGDTRYGSEYHYEYDYRASDAQQDAALLGSSPTHTPDAVSQRPQQQKQRQQRQLPQSPMTLAQPSQLPRQTSSSSQQRGDFVTVGRRSPDEPA